MMINISMTSVIIYFLNYYPMCIDLGNPRQSIKFRDGRRPYDDDRRGGDRYPPRDYQGGYRDRGGPPDRRGGYDDRRGGYDDRRGGYDDRRGGYDDRGGSYSDPR